MIGALLYFLGWFPKIDAGKLAAWIRKASWVLLPAGAALLLTRNPGLAVLAGMLSYSLMQKTGWLQGDSAQPGGKANISTVRTPYLEISLDHVTGAMSGRVLKGRFAGRALSSLTAAESLDCLSELRAADGQAAQLFEAFLERTQPGRDGGAGAGGSGRSRGMSIEEAYLVLGLNPGATRERYSSRPSQSHNALPSRSRRLDLSRRQGERGKGRSSQTCEGR